MTLKPITDVKNTISGKKWQNKQIQQLQNINTQKSVTFLYTNDKQTKMNIKDNFIYIIESEKNKIFRNKLNQRGKGLIHLKLQKNV